MSNAYKRVSKDLGIHDVPKFFLICLNILDDINFQEANEGYTQSASRRAVARIEKIKEWV